MANVLPVVAQPRVVRSGFDRVRLRTPVGGASLTKQAFKEECDINNIMKRFEKDGILAHYNQFQGDYGDFTSCPEYHEAQNKVMNANSMFLTLPAKVRERFSNDPARFLAFVSNPANRPGMVELGLLKAEAVVPPVPPVPPVPAPA
ncbi:MAG: internal scaffolding protein [Microvirus sp.]|nr:MAG: internal scaffolding protein [Microvirus sp.]